MDRTDLPRSTSPYSSAELSRQRNSSRKTGMRFTSPSARKIARGACDSRFSAGFKWRSSRKIPERNSVKKKIASKKHVRLNPPHGSPPDRDCGCCREESRPGGDRTGSRPAFHLLQARYEHPPKGDESIPQPRQSAGHPPRTASEPVCPYIERLSGIRAPDTARRLAEIVDEQRRGRMPVDMDRG